MKKAKMNLKSLPPVLDAETTGVMLNLSVQTVRKLARDKVLKAQKIGKRKWMFERDYIYSLIHVKEE